MSCVSKRSQQDTWLKLKIGMRNMTGKAPQEFWHADCMLSCFNDKAMENAMRDSTADKAKLGKYQCTSTQMRAW